MRGLYAIVDTATLRARGIAPLPFAEAVLGARPALLQLRAKEESSRDHLALLRSLRAACTAHGVPLVANDRPDLAVLAGADGVHVGQDDLPVEDVRRFAPGLRVGVSTHDPDQVRAALRAAPDYVAYGPVFATASKERPSPVVGLEGLAEAARICGAERMPLVAIGGIDLARAVSVAAHADLGAVIAALVPDEGLAGVRGRAEALHRALRG